MSDLKSTSRSTEYMDAASGADVPWDVKAETKNPEKVNGGQRKKEEHVEKKVSQSEKGDKKTNGSNMFSEGKARQGTLNKKGSRGFQRKFVRSDNPNVIFGRDFEDASIKIEEIIEEMGEVTVRGKILDVMTRELRNGEKTIVSFPVNSI